MEFVHALEALPWFVYPLALIAAAAWWILQTMIAKVAKVEPGSALPVLVWAFYGLCCALIWGIYFIVAGTAYAQVLGTEIISGELVILPFLVYFTFWTGEKIGIFVGLRSKRAYHVWKESDAVTLAKAKKLAHILVAMLPQHGWERERELITEVVIVRLPELFRQRKELTESAERLEEFVGRNREARGPESEELHDRCVESVRKLRERIQAATRDIDECLAFLARAEGEVRLAMLATEPAERSRATELFDEFVTSARVTAERHVAAQREVESDLAAARSQAASRVPAR